MITVNPGPRLEPGSGWFAATWQEFLASHAERLDTDVDPWRTHCFSAYGARALPAGHGTFVYSAVDVQGVCRYVGQSTDLRSRFANHACVPDGRLGRWAFVVVASFQGLLEGELDRAERIAKALCRPAEGLRHPRAV